MAALENPHAIGTPVLLTEGQDRDVERELRVLYEIIHTVASTLDLERVLQAIVRLVTEAVGAHATYIFLSEDRGRRIVLRAASSRYAHLCGTVSMSAGEGIAGWVLQHVQPVFIPDGALSDPRIRYFHKENGERGAARNYGARQARGRYLNFFDSDDEMYPNHLRVVREFVAARGEVEFLHTGYEVIDGAGRVVHDGR